MSEGTASGGMNRRKYKSWTKEGKNYFIRGNKLLFRALELSLYCIYFCFLIFFYLLINIRGIMIRTIKLISATRSTRCLHSLGIPSFPFRFALSGQGTLSSVDIFSKFSNAGQGTNTKHITQSVIFKIKLVLPVRDLN